MFAYCRNNPVCRKDVSGRDDVECTDLDNNDFTDDEDYFGAGGAGTGAGAPIGTNTGSGGGNSSSGTSGSGQYQPPTGGGGVTNTVNVNGTTVDFGHGGRHVAGENIADIENAIAYDVVNRPPSYGKATSVDDFMYAGQTLHYSYYTREPLHINVGTYYFMEQLR